VVAKRDEQVARALSRLWERIRAEDSRMPEITVGLTPSRSSSCSSAGWDSEPIVELNLQRDGENLTGRELLEYLLHQGAHGRSARSRPAKGDSTLRLTGTRRRAGARRRVERAGLGWDRTKLAKGTLSRYRAEVDQLDRAMKLCAR
jgi:hypothetical protein